MLSIISFCFVHFVSDKIYVMLNICDLIEYFKPEYVGFVRLKGVLEQMDRGIVDLQELRRNLELAAAMLDAVYTDETR